MKINSYGLIGTLFGILLFVWTLLLVKSDRIMLKFALPWLGLALFSVSFSLSENFAEWLTDLLGFTTPANVYLTVIVGSLVVLCILLSAEVTKSVERLERAASTIATLEGNVNNQ